MSVEHNIVPEGKEALIRLMTSKGYIYYMLFNTVLTHDLIFVKEGVLSREQLQNQTLPIIYERIENE